MIAVVVVVRREIPMKGGWLLYCPVVGARPSERAPDREHEHELAPARRAGSCDGRTSTTEKSQMRFVDEAGKMGDEGDGASRLFMPSPCSVR